MNKTKKKKSLDFLSKLLLFSFRAISSAPKLGPFVCLSLALLGVASTGPAVQLFRAANSLYLNKTNGAKFECDFFLFWVPSYLWGPQHSLEAPPSPSCECRRSPNSPHEIHIKWALKFTLIWSPKLDWPISGRQSNASWPCELIAELALWVEKNRNNFSGGRQRQQM